jgi:hypothetical protein
VQWQVEELEELHKELREAREKIRGLERCNLDLIRSVGDYRMRWNGAAREVELMSRFGYDRSLGMSQPDWMSSSPVRSDDLKDMVADGNAED